MLTLAPPAPMPQLFRFKSLTSWIKMMLVWNVPAVIALSYYYLNQSLTGGAMDWRFALITTFSNWYLWAMMTPFAWVAARRIPLEIPQNVPILLLGHAVVMLALLALQALGNLTVFRITGIHDTMNYQLWEVHFTLRMQINMLTYLLVIGVYYGYDAYRKYEYREKQAVYLQMKLAQAELTALKMQLQPHFLFNTLNAVAGLVRKNETKPAVSMLGKLGEFLRMVLESKGEQEIPLREELAFLQCYLAIEEVRFQDRLKVHFEIESGTEEAFIPNLILQPLVENAIRHGIAPHADAGRLVIRAKRDQGTLLLEVADDGPGLAQAPSRRGVGLSNIEQRLRELYGVNGHLHFGKSDLGGFLVSIQLPVNSKPTFS